MVLLTFSVLDQQDPFWASFVQKIHLAFLCYLSNLPAVQLQRLKASELSCYLVKTVDYFFQNNFPS